MSKGLIVCFTGVDGSGKSTHARSLMNHLETKGYACKYVWGASRPILSYVFLILTRFLGYWQKTQRDAYTDPLQYAPMLLRHKLAKLWFLFLFADFQMRTLLEMGWSLLAGRLVVCDRYFYDSLMDLEVSCIFSEKYATILSRTMPKPLIVFLMDAPPSLTSKRRDFSFDELSAKRNAFLKLSKIFPFIVVDSSRGLLDNQMEIRTITEKRLQGRVRLKRTARALLQHQLISDWI